MQSIFLSYEYRHDAARAQAVRAAWLAQGGTATLESAQASSDLAIKQWIDHQLEVATVTIVLMSAYTASSRWVKYEIERTKALGKGLLGIDVSGMHQGQHGGGCSAIPLLAGHASYDWVKDDGARNLAAWVAQAAGGARRRATVNAP